MPIGLGQSISSTDISANVAAESSGSRSSGTAWTETAAGIYTTPTIALSGAIRATAVSLWVDENNDWSGTAGDYSLEDATILNVTDGGSLTGQTITFPSVVGTVGGAKVLISANINMQSSPVSGGSGDTIRVTGNLTRSGYQTIEISAEATY